MENQDQAQMPGNDVGAGAQAPQEAPNPELNVVDLQNIRAIIDTAARRGAFGAAEMTGVGVVFDRLNNFINAVAPQQPATPDQAGTTAPSAE